MTSWKSLVPSDYYKGPDVQKPLLLTVKGVRQEPNPFEQGTNHVVMGFREPGTKKLVMKPALYAVMEEISGTDEIEGWTGLQIVLYFDPSVMYMGKRVGGVRLRAPRPTYRPPVQQPQPEPESEPYDPGAESFYDPNDDIPFSFLLPWLIPAMLLGNFMV